MYLPSMPIMFTLSLIIFSLLFAYLSWKKINWAIALVVFSLPSYLIRFQISFVPMTLLEWMILILFLVWLVKSIKQLSNLTIKQLNNLTIKQFGFWFWLIIAWLVIATISMFVSPDLRAAAGVWKAYFNDAILLYVVFKQKIK